MRAARGAASSAQATDRSLSGRPESSFPPLGPCSRRGIAIPGPKWPANRAAPFLRLALSATGGASPGNSPHRTRCAAVGGFAALRMRRAPCGYFAGRRRGPQLPQAPANGAGGNARSVYALSVQPTAAVSPRFGGRRGSTPGPFFPPISLGRNGGARRVGGAGGASDKNPAKPPSKKRPAPRGHPGRRMARRGRRAPRVGGYAGKRATTGRPYRRSKSYPGKSRQITGLAVAIPPRGRRVRDAVLYFWFWISMRRLTRSPVLWMIWSRDWYRPG